MNRFKRPELRETYEAYTYHWRNRQYLWEVDGSQSRSNTARCAFWNGFNGDPNFLFEKGSPAYAAYRAGQDCAKEAAA